MTQTRPRLTDVLKRYWYVAALLVLAAVGVLVYIFSQGMSAEQLLR